MGLAVTCRMNGINAQEYFEDMISRIATHPASRLGELLPVRWAELRKANSPQP